MIRVDDPDDPRIEHYRAVRDRDIAGRVGRFVAEGDVVVRALLGPGSRFRPESLLLSKSRAPALSPLIERLPPDIPVFVADGHVMDAIVGFHIHRGVLAIGLRGPDPDIDVLLAGLPARATVLGLVGLSNHDNVGGAFRNAAAFGASAVVLDGGSCDPLYRKATRVSVGASLLVPFARARTPSDLVGALAGSGFTSFALSPSGSTPLERVAWPSRTALLAGAEGAGLPNEILARVQGVRIGMAEGFDSLNVATASAVALHALRTSAGPVAD